MFDLCLPMEGCVMNQRRYFFLEGDMKFKDNIGKVRRGIQISLTHQKASTMLLCMRFDSLSPSQMDVHCFLLTDIFLVCKQTAKKAHGNLKVS
jgi:hypothetical protein